MLGISAAFLTDVEKGRRYSFYMDKLAWFAEILNLSKNREVKTCAVPCIRPESAFAGKIYS